MSAHIAVAVLLCTSVCQPETLRIWDGDSFLIGRQSGSEKVRVENIDTPEIDGKCASERRMAVSAKKRFVALVANQKIQVLRSGQDKYAFFNREIWLESKLFGIENVDFTHFS